MYLLNKLILIVFCNMMFHAITYGQMNATYAATVGGEWSGSMKKGHFLAQTGVGAFHRVSFNHWERIKVDSFNVTIVRDTSIILMTKNAGNVFHENLKTLLKGIMTGDKVLIFDIYATDLSKKKVFLAPLEYLIE